MSQNKNTLDREAIALGKIAAALSLLDEDSQDRVVQYLHENNTRRSLLHVLIEAFQKLERAEHIVEASRSFVAESNKSPYPEEVERLRELLAKHDAENAREQGEQNQ